MRITRWIAVVFAVAWPLVGHAANSTWTSVSPTGTYSDPGNWSSGVPGPTDIGFFNNNLDYTIFFNASTNLGHAFFDATTGGTVTQAIGGNTWTVIGQTQIGVNANRTNTVVLASGIMASTNAGAIFNVGNDGVGRMVVNDGTLLAQTMTIANNPTSQGTLTVAGGTTWLENSITVGNQAGSFGSIDVTGGRLLVTNAAQAVILGYLGSARMTVSGGVVDLYRLEAALSSTQTGTITISGGTTTVRPHDYSVRLGYTGHGVLEMTGGSLTVTNSSGFVLGLNAGAVGTITMSGGLVTNAGHLSIGAVAGSTGVVSQTGGTWVNSGLLWNSPFVVGNLNVGNGLNGMGTLTVGGGTLQINGPGNYILVGDTNGKGVINVTNGTFQLNDVGNGLVLGRFGGNATLNFSGGTITANAGTPLRIGGEFTTREATGSVVQTGGTWRQNAITGIGVAGLGTYTLSGGTFSGAVVNVGSDTTGAGRLIVSGGNSLFQATSLHVGNTGTAKGQGSVWVTNAGVIEANTLVTGSAGSGTISNRGGVLQFTRDDPTITAGTAGSLVITNGTVSFRGIDDANVRANQGGGNQLQNFTWQGANTFRLNASSNLNASSQAYTFTDTLGPTNFARLELINGHTAYRGGNVTIGNTGSMLISNTRATVTGLFTNNGVFTSLNSVGTFNSAVVNNGAWITDPTTLTFQSDYTVGNSGSISMGTGDVFVFQSNFVNQSQQSTTYDTLAGKFVFSGTSQTQAFATAGLDLGPGWTYQSPLDPTNILPGPQWGTGPTADNFALMTLEISNYSTVRVTDAFSAFYSNNDNERAALYLQNLWLGQNSFLIIDTNVSVYFFGTNDWSAVGAGYALIGDAELHQLVPEPSVLLLVLGGVVTVFYARRRRE